jgi:hypothetical protein
MADDSGGGGTSPWGVAIVAVVSAAIAGAASFGAGYLAIGILRADPKEDVTPARGWALDIIEKNSGVPFSQDDREALLHKPLSGKEASWKVDTLEDWVAAMRKEGLFVGPEKRLPAEGK